VRLQTAWVSRSVLFVIRAGEFGHRKNDGLHLEKFFQPWTELRVLQPPTEFSERIWVNKKNISK
jgi:hypothetical protein